ncbi:histidinol-phosphatase HisJ [Salipaludibacillus agaradhaerens]|uniref:Histidinol-phosphatase n=1 Tax=Salipaludibacillus agaradhaerens TaxID=76935 RepID=A0A9Q4AZ96_SALAG|nr:histidinol-phosphatase HisJ [Salipaludibacillus agaradhaerens]MCR6114929.1 histidinol-phosphatase HisJ [Salipaludibacillus agaradhaerens]
MERSKVVVFLHDFLREKKGDYDVITHDRHIHTPFCPHGSSDPLEAYIENAIDKGVTSITFTEHAPLPNGFTDPVPTKDSALSPDQLSLYIDTCYAAKKTYAPSIEINIGLEIDYIDGFSEQTAMLLNTWGHQLDDSILSVHFLQVPDGSYHCIDYSREAFQSLISACGSIKKVYELYYKTVQASIEANLGQFTPCRIGHISLARKFQKLFPRDFDDTPLIMKTLETVRDNNKSLDINIAGLSKEHCRETYPPLRWIEKAKEMNIPLVYGSDAHTANYVGTSRDEVARFF